jgi:hypothetical protein
MGLKSDPDHNVSDHLLGAPYEPSREARRTSGNKTSSSRADGERKKTKSDEMRKRPEGEPSEMMNKRKGHAPRSELVWPVVLLGSLVMLEADMVEFELIEE